MIDFHSHILPGIDDGASDVETAVSMLIKSKSQGVETVIATPHYYSHKQTVDEFLKCREESYEQLKKYLDENRIDVPEIRLGAEVRFSHEIMEMQPERLKIEGTNTILIELPFTYWNDWVYDDLFKLAVKHKLKVVIAHLERYIENVKAFKHINSLFDMNNFIQVNADSVLDRKQRKVIKNLFKKYRVDLIGTDMHNLTTRTTNMDKALSFIRKKYGEDYIGEIFNNSKKLLM
jgi:protein-tyrosine phosphatase